MIIPAFVSQILGVLVRAAVVYIAAFLAGRGGAVYDENQITEIVTTIVPVLAVIVWSIWSKYRGRQKLMVAQASDAVMTENQVEKLVSHGGAPSVLTSKSEVPK